MLAIIIFNVIWGVYMILEYTKTVSLLFAKSTAFGIIEIWFAVALVGSFLLFALKPTKDKKVENYKCPHCGNVFKGGLKPTFCSVCKSSIDQPVIDKKNKYFKG